MDVDPRQREETKVVAYESRPFWFHRLKIAAYSKTFGVLPRTDSACGRVPECYNALRTEI